MAEKRQAFLSRVKRIPARRLVFLDESGANTAMGRDHAWVLRGERRLDPRPMNWGDNLTMIGAMRRHRWIQLSTMFQSANGERFVGWLRTRLLPRLRRGDVLVMDNAAAHHNKDVRPVCRARGVRVLYLPPYSPDFNPIEPGWGLVKKHLRARAPRSRVELRRAAHAARRRVKPLHCRRFFRHAGYQ